MKRIFVLILLACVFGSGAWMFCEMVINDADIAMTVPTVLFAALFIGVVWLIIKETVIGVNIYKIENNSLHIMRKGTEIASFSKEDIEKVTLVNDAVTGDLHYACIYALGRRWCITSGENASELEELLSGIPAQNKSNLWYYIVRALTW